jgi:hypothetical protein
LCENALINHCIASQDHHEIDDLVWIMKHALQKYGLQKNHTRDWNPWLLSLINYGV